MAASYMNGRARAVCVFHQPCLRVPRSREYGSVVGSAAHAAGGVELAVEMLDTRFDPTADAWAGRGHGDATVETTLYMLKTTDVWTAVALLLITALTVTALVIARRAAALSREIAARHEAEADMQRLNAALEARVRER